MFNSLLRVCADTIVRHGVIPFTVPFPREDPMSSKVALLGAAGVAVGALWFAYRQRQEATATPADSAAAAEDSAAAPSVLIESHDGDDSSPRLR